ncbi:putative sensor domain DACNV-containing protein [Desulfosediminicola ganghwensis]|uniref:putative sensor domain DACNV-containing protein n=1 Tax=Desulfosediminicola ganghwensis TaxID=2569540 RepID=UPI0010AD37A9|nr:hypothetical protein [Desulfosediminicola ganghwensis]
MSTTRDQAMHHHAYSLNSEFVDELLQRMHQLTGSSAPSRFPGNVSQQPGTIPTTEQLASLLDGAFWTSFSLDEGNVVTISILFMPAEKSHDTFLFDRPILFDVKNLVKLGAALENPRADIGVWPDENGLLKIWGFKTRNNDLLIAQLWIQVLGPGRVLTTFNGKSIGSLISNTSVFIDHSNMMKTVLPKLDSSDTGDQGQTLKMLRYTSLLNTARAMRNHSRGGTLLVVPNSDDWRLSISAPIPYTGGASFLESDYDVAVKPTLLAPITDFFSGLIKTKEDNKRDKLVKMRTQVDQQCRHIARLTAVDGALVMTFDRFVFCFGAKIIPREGQEVSSTIRVIKPVEGDSATTVGLADIGGTRHQSAALFAQAQPGAVAVVVSQDGDITIFTTDDESGEVIAIQQAELLVLHEGLGATFWNFTENRRDPEE